MKSREFKKIYHPRTGRYVYKHRGNGIKLYIILKNQKNLCVGSCNYLSYTIKKGSNWYMETGVRDLEVVFFKANSSRFNDIYSKDLSIRPI